MSFNLTERETIQRLIDDRSIRSIVKRKSPAADEIRSLQTILYQLGFGKELAWEAFGADGDYGGNTTIAVLNFAAKHNIQTSGKSVTLEIARLLLARFDILEEMRYIHGGIQNETVEERLFFNSKFKVAVAALQTLLNELGLGRTLKWKKFGADGGYGNVTIKAVARFAKNEGFESDGKSVSRALAQRIIDKLTRFYGSQWAQVKPSEITLALPGNLTLKQKKEREKFRLYISDGTSEVRFTKFRRGVYYFGKQTVIDTVNNNKTVLQNMGLTDSALNVMIAVSENEGNLDAVNTWDNAFLTFGMFQWTIGTGSGAGELAALVKKIKEIDTNVFQDAYGRHGLDVVLPLTDPTRGYFTLNGTKVDTPAEKAKLRSIEWAYYFWKSGQMPLVLSTQIQHALSRIDVFYHSESYRPNGFFIDQLITSEYGVGLILDNHVNRPAYIKPTLEEALNRTQLKNPGTWGTTEESELIAEYIKVRSTFGQFPMTDADKRAAVTKKYVNNGTISNERDSFRYKESG